MAKILVIDDDQLIRSSLQDALHLQEFTAIAAHNGEVGLQLALTELPDLILCDVNMPGMSGYEVLTALRQNSATALIPVIFLTARTERSDVRKGMDLGADDYLYKPFVLKELLSAIASRLEKKALLERQAAAQLDELRSTISLSLPHELHTPLNVILGMSEILTKEHSHFGRTEIIEIAETINSSAKRLYRLTQNFLLYAKLELTSRDPKRLHAFQESLKLEWSEVCQTFSLIAHKKAMEANRETDLKLHLQECDVQISETYLRKIAEELIDNAFKFSQAGTAVEILAEPQVNTVVISITDYGRGITSEQIASIGAYHQFERKFYEQQGTGLGLAIAKRLVELHHGKFTIASQLAKQTTVRLTLPRSDV
jgi:signal transduction histidine kinase